MNTTKFNIDKRQVIILISAGIMFIVVFIFWQFLYLPKRRDITSILQKVKDFDINIKEEEVRVKAEGYEKEIAKMQAEVTKLQDKFPSQNELPGMFQELFNQADKFNIEIISIEPDKAMRYESQTDTKSDLIFNKVPIKLKLNAGYRPLTEFLKVMFENTQYAFSFDELKISKLKGSASELEIELLLGAFVLSHGGALNLEADVEKGVDLHLKRKKRK
ncbi:MAG: type 4a pilus biogenesis protein PilO [Candidatus Omnitrophica bacterium]|nr:type 4a pilus biogenesis protein PilO [Candidatus Omnitrophota bacterium]